MPAELITPGIYIDEVMPFPPAVNEVETAIPAFIGYTEKAVRNGKNLFLKPCVVQSLAEFESLYGKNANTHFRVLLDSSNAVSDVNIIRHYYLYDSVRLFFHNGGGKCVIISVGKYRSSGAVKPVDLFEGLDILENEDEPTLIVCPDAVLCEGNGLYDFHKKALEQCNRRGDRILICDIHRCKDLFSNHELSLQVQEYRTGIGTEHLRFGAAYVPFLQTSFPRNIRFRDIQLHRMESISGRRVKADWLQLSTSKVLEKHIEDLLLIIQINDLISGTVSFDIPFTPALRTPDKKFTHLVHKLKSTKDSSLKIHHLKELYSFIFQMTAAVEGIRNYAASAGSARINVLMQQWETEIINSGLKEVVIQLFQHSLAFSGGDSQKLLVTGNINEPTSAEYKVVQLLQTSLTTINQVDPTISDVYKAQTKESERILIAESTVLSCGNAVCAFIMKLKIISESSENDVDINLEEEFWMYKQIRQNIAVSASVIPPSGAVAGIYARVDGSRGVWKAPANERIISVVQPAVQITADEQSKYNVDLVAGKSINCIRSFTGAGVVVWGARTLAGNDNEWRYVNVRRFFNMVNESCKKSLSAFVFEPNDSNTWIRVKSMIESYLTGLWRKGALQGSKPEHAFYVSVGKGYTMTEQDVLEGRMIIEIGIAMIRPAEFIIIRINQDMGIT